MIFDDKANRMTFMNDDDLCDFAVQKKLNVYTDNDGNDFVDWEFTDNYNDAVAANTEFLINDLNSRILKNGLIDWRGITKPISISGNYEKIFEEIDEEMDKEVECLRSKKKK